MTENLMSDAVDTIELRLRAEAGAARGSQRRRRVPAIALTTGLAAGLALVVLASTLTDRSKPSDAGTLRGDGEPLILRTAAAHVPGVIAQLESGGTVPAVLGSDAHLTDARPVKAFGGTAYVVTGDKGWCLVLPDPAIAPNDNPRGGSGVTCRTTADVHRIGISLIVGSQVLAAVPQGVPNPTLTARDGTVSDLQPNDQGTVAVEDAAAGSVLTLRGKDGAEETLHVQ